METYTFLKNRQDINDVPLKSLTFQTGQTKWDGGSITKRTPNYQLVFKSFEPKDAG